MVNPLTGQPGFSLQDEALVWAAKLHAHVDLSAADMKSIAWLLETLVRERAPNHAVIHAAYDKWRGAEPTNARDHLIFGAGYLARLSAPVPDKPDYKAIARAYDEWTKHDESLQSGPDHVIFGAGYLAGQRAVPVPAREWIPVGERLPETPLHVGPYSGAHIQRSAEVLMAYGDGLVGAGKYSATRVEGRWYRNSHRVTGITHWMPLPPPPAADK